MSSISRVLGTFLAIAPFLYATPASAQIAATKPYASLFLVRDVNAVEVPERARTLPLMSASTPAPPLAATPNETAVKGTPRGLQPALYAGLIALQGLDVHSTLRAMDAGHSERNPMMRWAVSHPAALISMKAAASTATIFVAEQIRKRHPKRAAAFIAAMNAAYALIVVHNYKVPIR